MIRHGQASFGKENYDKLSDTGLRQSVLLGKHLASLGIPFDSVYTGSLLRHQETLEGIRKGFAEKGGELPESVIEKGINEYNSEALVRTLIPEIIKDDPSYADDLRHFFTDDRAFSRIFEAVILKWVNGPGYPELMSFDDFFEKVNAGINEILEKEKNSKNVMVVTSGGPLSITIKRALDLSGEHTMRLNWHIKNCSLTRIKFRDDRMILETFNEINHLESEDRSLVTLK